MGDISVNPVASAVEPSSGAAAAAPADRTLNRAVSAAVAKLNEASYLGDGKALAFSVDQTTKRPVVKVIDTNTNEVITQWPPEYLLQVASETTSGK